MNKYERAINYFYKQMESGNIEDDEQQLIFETAIELLQKLVDFDKLKDIEGTIIIEGHTLKDGDGRKYKVIGKDGELYAKSQFRDDGCGEYILYQNRINSNEFKVFN